MFIETHRIHINVLNVLIFSYFPVEVDSNTEHEGSDVLVTFRKGSWLLRDPRILREGSRILREGPRILFEGPRILREGDPRILREGSMLKPESLSLSFPLLTASSFCFDNEVLFPLNQFFRRYLVLSVLR